jgi:Raf kinase inhibitor-like YbhB/YbcL family protein
MKLESSAFQNEEFIPSLYTCDGENFNPELKIIGIPSEAISLILIVEDPDAPNKTFLHWLVWNIDPQVKIISRNSIPKGGIEGKTDFGQAGYGGPCPPSGTHRYFFRIFALDKKLPIDNSLSRKEIEGLMGGHILAQGELMGRYQRL